MVRIKNRWLLVEFLNPDLSGSYINLTSSKIFHALKESVISNFGDAGWGAVGVSLSVKYYSSTTSICIIRVGREHVRIAHAAVTLLTVIDDKPTIPVVLHCSGTIKKLQNAAIAHNRLIVARFRSKVYQKKDSSILQARPAFDNYLETSTREIEMLQD